MWIVRLALRRPYTFVIMSLLITLLGGVAIDTMPVDIFPYIDIPVLSVLFNYGGLSPEEMANRVVTVFERSITSTVTDIDHIESQFYPNGAGHHSGRFSALALWRQVPPGDGGSRPRFHVRERRIGNRRLDLTQPAKPDSSRRQRQVRRPRLLHQTQQQPAPASGTQLFAGARRQWRHGVHQGHRTGPRRRVHSDRHRARQREPRRSHDRAPERARVDHRYRKRR